MQLFFSPTSPYVRKCLASAQELGLSGRISLLPSAAHPVDRDGRILVHNPLGKVPTLLTDDGRALYDSRVICEYLDSLGPGGGGMLFPGGAVRWDALTLQALGDGILDAALLARYEDALRPEPLRWADWRAGQLDKVRTALAALGTPGSGAPALDDSVHIGSISLGCALWYLDLRFPDLGWRDQQPRVAQWWERFGQRPSMAATWTLA